MASITDICQGTWLHDQPKDDNIEEYLKTIGIGLPIRLVAKKLKTNMKISVDKSNKKLWSVTRISTLETKETVFTLGETFKDKTFNGKVTTNLWMVDGNKLMGVTSGFCKHEIHITMEFLDDHMIQTLTVDGVVAKNYYNKEKK